MQHRRVSDAVRATVLALIGVLAATIAMSPLAPSVRADDTEEMEEAAQVEQAAQPGPDDPALLRELVERLLSPPFPPLPDDTPRLQLLPGALPPNLPLEVPRPPGSRLIGSVLRPSFGPGQFGPGPVIGMGAEIVLDVPGAAPEVFALYERELGEQGWTAPPFTRGGRPGGFQPTQQPFGAPLCKGEQGPFVSLTVFPRTNAPSDVRIRVEAAGGPGPCGGPFPSGPRPPEGPPGFDRIPLLTPPAGVVLQTSGFGGGPGRFSSDALAETAMSVAELEAHYAQQLTAAGWTRRDGGVDGPLAWSFWTVPGEGDFQGFLYVLEGPGANRRSLHVEAASATLAGGPGGPVAIAVPAPLPPR